jgi:hypothetical protein
VTCAIIILDLNWRQPPSEASTTHLERIVNLSQLPVVQMISLRKSNSPLLLSSLILVLSFGQALAGLVSPSLYRDGPWVRSAWLGNDAVTLLCAVPAFVCALILSIRGSERARLVWIGMLFYMFYNYAFYVFGAAVNRLFIAYVLLMTSSAYALILAFVGADVQQLSRILSTKIIHKLVASYMGLMVLTIASLWIVQWIAFVATGKAPQLGGSEEGYRLVASLDLSIQVPALTLGAIWLWKRSPWGYVAATALMVADAVYMVVLLAFSPFAAKAGLPDPWQPAPLWAFFGTGCALSSLALLKSHCQVDACLPATLAQEEEDEMPSTRHLFLPKLQGE